MARPGGGVHRPTTPAQPWQPVPVAGGARRHHRAQLPGDGLVRRHRPRRRPSGPCALTSADGGRTWIAARAARAAPATLTALDCATRFDCQAWAFTTSNGHDQRAGAAQRRRRPDLAAAGRGPTSGRLGAGRPQLCRRAALPGGRLGARPARSVRTTTDGGRHLAGAGRPAGDATSLTSVGCTAQACVLLGRTGTAGAARCRRRGRPPTSARRTRPMVLPADTVWVVDVDCSPWLPAWPGRLTTRPTAEASAVRQRRPRPGRRATLPAGTGDAARGGLRGAGVRGRWATTAAGRGAGGEVLASVRPAAARCTVAHRAADGRVVGRLGRLRAPGALCLASAYSSDRGTRGSSGRPP